MKFQTLFESISAEDTGMALNAIQTYLERKLDEKLTRLKWNRVSNKGMNVIFTKTQDAGAIKFNFEIESKDMKYIKKDSYGCTSVDIYSATKTNNEIGLIEKPTVTLQIPNGISFVKILPKIVDLIKNPIPKTFTLYKLNIDGTSETIIEDKRGAKPQPIEIDGVQYSGKMEAYYALRAHGVKVVDANRKIKRASGEEIIEDEVEITVTKGVKDIEDQVVANEQTEKLKELYESLMSDIEYKSPIEMFNDVEHRIDDLIKPTANNRSLVITGMGGIGKTYTVTKHLKNIGVDYANGSEVPSVVALFKLLFLNKNEGRLLLFDDCDAVVRNPETQNILKLALDTSVSPISYFATKGVFNVEVDKSLSPIEMNTKVDREFILRNAIVLGYANPEDDEQIEDVETPEEYADPTGDFAESRKKHGTIITEKKKYTKQELLNMAMLNPDFANMWKSKAPIDIAKIINAKGINIGDLIFPAKFFYRGKMIFVSNMDETKWPAPLSSRAFKVNIWLTANEVLDLIRHIMPDISKQYSMKVKKRAFEVFEKNIDRIDAYFKIKHPGNTAYFNLRSYSKALDIANNESLNSKTLEAQILRFCLA